MSEPKQIIPDMGDEARREFVRAWLSGQVFTSCHLGREGADHMLGQVFMPVMLGGLGPPMIELKELPSEIPDDMGVDEWEVLQNGGHDRMVDAAEKINDARMAQYSAELGIVWEYLSEALPRSINGYPIFMSCRVMNKSDWNKIWPVLQREEDRLKSIEV